MKTRIITITNQKGGVGKTTSVLNIAAALARRGHKTVVIDLDSQANLTYSLLGEEPLNTLYTHFVGECDLADALRPIIDNMVLLPANHSFSNFESRFGGQPDGFFMLKDCIENELQEALGAEPEFVLIDTPPALGLITSNSLTATQEVYVPMHSQQFSLSALENVSKAIEQTKKRFNNGLELKGIFFTRHNPRKSISKQMIELLEEEYPGMLMDTFIRVNVSLEESPSLHTDVFRHNPESNGAKDYDSLTNEIIKRG